MPRRERDLLGELELPDDALYGVQTERARRNFDAAGRPVRPELIRALALVKKACCLANAETGFLDPARADAIAAACDAIVRGDHADQFVTDALQGGAGTSTNMNVNEVVARLASRQSGLAISALDHVNRHQSTNDVYPTALRVAAILAVRDLEKAVTALQEAYQERERALADVVKLGRTQLRDAVPLTLGREFGAAAAVLARDRWRLGKCVERLRVVNLGGTAVGTGLAAPTAYIFAAIETLRRVTGLGLARADNLVDATQNQDALAEVSGMLRVHAANLMKFARDLRLLSSGPEGGLAEIELPALQPGSSLMPGKINPVIPEMVMQVAARVLAHDAEVAWVVASGELELNAFLPLAADALLSEIRLLERADRALARHVPGIRADADRCRLWLERSREVVAALIPRLGHARAVELAAHMARNGRNVREAVRDLGLMTDSELDDLLAPGRLCALGWREPPPPDREEPRAPDA